LVLASPVAAQPNPVLNSIFPAGGCAGTSVDVTVPGSGLGGLKTLHCSTANLTYEVIDKTHVRIRIPEDAPPGFHDLRVVCNNGLSSPRAFMIGTLNEAVEVEPNDLAKTATLLSLNSVVNGRIDKKGDIDQFQFVAKRGQQIVIECRAERIDSPLRAVLELYDDEGERLAVNRGYFGVDPLIPFRIPADGTYTVKVFDLVYAGGADSVYRLTIGDKPKVVFSHPAVVPSGQASRVTLYGWNLSPRTPTADPLGTQAGEDLFETVEVDVDPPAATGGNPHRLSSIQADVNSFAFRYRNSDHSIQIGLTDVPVVQDQAANHTSETAQSLTVPCEVGGQLSGGDDHEWYAIHVRRGEVLWLEGFGARIGSPVDLDISILDALGKRELARFSDNLQNIGGNSFKTSHPDPAGRWVAPADGRYLILVRNVIGDLARDPRRVYRLSLRREDPDFHLALVDPRDTPAAINVQRGGRTTVDVLAFRHRGMNDTIRVSARNLPPGIECPDVYLGPGVNRAPLTLSASDSTETSIAGLDLVGHAITQETHLDTGWSVRGGTVVRAGELNNTARLTAAIPFAVTGEAPLRITADGNEPRSHDTYGQLKVRHSPGSIVDVAVQVDRRDVSHQAEVQLLGEGLPKRIQQQTATIPAGQSKGYISFYLPPTLPIGSYTFAIKAVTTVAASSPKGKPQTVTVISNPVTIPVQPAAFVMEIDPYAPTQIARGQVVQVKYSAQRINGFIGKIHTELFAPDHVVGLRGRGVTFVGQTESGTIQIIANEDAPLGQQPFVRFYGVGVVEDQPVYHGSCFLKLEITEQGKPHQ
ncbi:MAG: PPC domain-containing protein, partial [Planctomycetaceae bacterium]|nr:PPC domain-containing protein [Planctomycetaceae bacterium]